MRQAIEQYVPIAEMIGRTFGKDCEVVLHDLADPEHTVVHTVNNSVTKRQIGESFNQLVPQVLLDKSLDSGLVANYYFHTQDGRLIKSSTALIKDGSNNVIGAMCINVDTTHITRQIAWLQEMLPCLEDIPEKEAPMVDADTNINDVAEVLIDHMLVGKRIEFMSRREKAELMNDMERRGIFLMKGAIDKVSAKTGISKVTIYGYLDKNRNR